MFCVAYLTLGEIVHCAIGVHRLAVHTVGSRTVPVYRAAHALDGHVLARLVLLLETLADGRRVRRSHGEQRHRLLLLLLLLLLL